MKHPLEDVRWVDRDAVRPNAYNPNSQLSEALNLLIESIRADGWTQPIVVRPPDADGVHVIVDGEHRWQAAAVIGGRIPIVVLNGDDAGCIASTVRHNRARGSHGVDGMVALIKELRDKGFDDARIEKELGMSAQERERLEISEEAFLHIMAGRDMAMEA